MHEVALYNGFLKVTKTTHTTFQYGVSNLTFSLFQSKKDTQQTANTKVSNTVEQHSCGPCFPIANKIAILFRFRVKVARIQLAQVTDS